MSERDGTEEDAATADPLLPVLVGFFLGGVTVVFLIGVVPWPVALTAGAVVWFLVTSPLRGDGQSPEVGTVEGSPYASRVRSAVSDAATGVDALAEDVPDGGLPVARGILDRAERYLDHGDPGRAREAAERAYRVARAEAAVRSTLADAGAVRGHVEGVRRMETLLADAKEASDAERAGELVGEARRVADGLASEVRSAADDRAAAARRAAARDDGERARQLWEEAYDLATAAVEIADGEEPTAAGTAGEEGSAATESETGTGTGVGTGTGTARRRPGEAGDPSDRRETERES